MFNNQLRLANLIFFPPPAIEDFIVELYDFCSMRGFELLSSSRVFLRSHAVPNQTGASLHSCRASAC